MKSGKLKKNNGMDRKDKPDWERKHIAGEKQQSRGNFEEIIEEAGAGSLDVVLVQTRHVES